MNVKPFGWLISLISCDKDMIIWQYSFFFCQQVPVDTATFYIASSFFFGLPQGQKLLVAGNTLDTGCYPDWSGKSCPICLLLPEMIRKIISVIGNCLFPFRYKN